MGIKINTELYSKVILMIGSCLNMSQLTTCFNYIEQIRLNDENLANSLMYQYEIKKELFFLDDIEVEYECLQILGKI